MLLRRIIADNSGASAAEYALILGAFGGLVAVASMALSVSIKPAMGITAYGPGGTPYTCTANCQLDFKDYCAAIGHTTYPDGTHPTFSPALPAGAKCDGETPVS